MKHNSLLMGQNASGSIGNTLTASNYKGIGELKSKASQSNPNTVDQQTQRNNWADIVAYWQSGIFDATDQLAYRTLVSKTSQRMSGFNYFLKIYREVFVNGDTAGYFNTYSESTVGVNKEFIITGTEAVAGVSKIYTQTGTFVSSNVENYAAPPTTTTIALTALPTKGYIQHIYTAAGTGGRSGYYYFVQ